MAWNDSGPGGGEIGSAYVRIRPKADRFGSEARRELGPAMAAAGKDAGEQFTRGVDGKLRDSKGRFVGAGESAGAATASGVTRGFGKLDVSKVLGGVRTAAAETGKAVAGGLAVGTLAVAALGTSAIRTQMEFAAAMSQVASVSNASATELQTLREAALEAGAASVFTATEAATAQSELARAGVANAEILGGALTGSLDLAAAGQLGLADAATIAAQAMNVFKLGGDEVTHVADVLAAGANKSAADVAQLGWSMRMGGLMASQMGIGLEETIGAFSLFADNALIGSDAGTSFKVMLQALTPSTGPAKSAMAELGLSFFDAEGKFVGLEEAAGRLQESMRDLTDEQRAAAMETIFGSDGVRAANILYNQGAEGVREYTAAVNDQGAAARMAAIALDNLKGDVEALEGEVETAQIRVGDLFDRTLRSMAQGAEGTLAVFNSFAESPSWDRLQTRMDRIGNMAGGLFTGVGESLADALGAISPADVDRVFDRIEKGAVEARDALEGAEGVVAGLGLSLAGLGARSVLGPLGGVVPALNPVVGILGGLVLGSDEGREALGRLGRDAATTGRSMSQDLLRSVGEVADGIGADLGEAVESLGSAGLDAAEILGPVLGRAVEELGPIVGDLVVSTADLVSRGLVPMASVASDVLNPALSVLSPALRIAGEGVELLADNAWLLVPALSAVAAVKLTDTVSGWGGAVQNSARSLGTAVGDFRTHFGVLRAEGETMRGSLEGAGKATGGLAGSLASVLNPAVLGVTAAITVGFGVYEAWSSKQRELRQQTEALTSALVEQGDSVLPSLARSFQEILEVNKGYDEAFAKTGFAVSSVTELINANAGDMDAFRKEWHAAGEELGTFVEEGKAIPEGVRPMVESLFELRRQGSLTPHELRQVINAMTNLDLQAKAVSDTLSTNAGRFKEEAEGVTLSAEAHRLLDTAMNSDNVELQREAYDRLLMLYPELAEGAGLWTGELETGARDALGEIIRLGDELRDMAGMQLEMDQAARRWLDAQDALGESFERNGKTLDQSIPAGRRNRDALDAQVKAAFDLAAAQAEVDLTGEKSTETLNLQALALADLRSKQIIPTDEAYADLLHQYGLTPPQITTRVEADTQEAKARIADLRDRLRNLDGVAEPLKAEIQAKIDQGDYNAAEWALAALERQRTAYVDIKLGKVQTNDGRTWGSIDAAVQNSANGGRTKVLWKADGGLIDYYARGGMRTGSEHHVAQIAPAGAWRVWAEPETGGESYIPLAPTKRNRSVPIWLETGRRLGIDVDLLEDMRRHIGLAFAEGGIIAPSAPVHVAVPPLAGGAGEAMAGELRALRQDLARLAQVVAQARPITVVEADSARRTAEEIVALESRPGRMLTADPRGL